MAFGNPTGEFASPEYVDAFIDYILYRMELIFWNREQRQWDRTEDPKILGIEFRPYWWGDEDSEEADKPNLAFGEAHIRWYKHPGRGQTVNVDWKPDQWVEWFDAVQSALTSAGKEDLDG